MRLQKWLLTILLLGMGGCASDYLGVSVTPADPGSVPAFRSFEVEAQALPAFLGPIIVSNFSVAMAERGLQPVSQGGDAVVTLRYVQDELATSETDDEFGGQTDPGANARFMARVVVEIRGNESSEIVWSGSIQRLHTIRPGDYMHTGRASVALLEAFRRLLSDYPALSEEMT